MQVLPVENEEVPHIAPQGRSIVVFLTPYRFEELRFFRCVACGKALFKYQHEVGMVIDSPDCPDDNSIQLKCQRCGLLYRVMW